MTYLQLFEYGDKASLVAVHLHRLIPKIWQLENMPKEWIEAFIGSIFKKADLTDCAIYRGIRLCVARLLCYITN